MGFKRRLGVLLFALLGSLSSAQAQSVTGQISGNGADASGGALVGAVVRLTHDLSQQDSSFTTASNAPEWNSPSSPTTTGRSGAPRSVRNPPIMAANRVR